MKKQQTTYYIFFNNLKLRMNKQANLDQHQTSHYIISLKIQVFRKQTKPMISAVLNFFHAEKTWPFLTEAPLEFSRRVFP